MAPYQLTNDVFPCPSAQPISVDFIENRDAGFRNAQGELLGKFDPSSQKFVASSFAFGGAVLDNDEEALRNSKLRVNATTESFAAAITALKKTTKKSKDKKIADFDLDSCHDWKEITNVIHVVVENYHNDDTTWGRIRAGFRRVGDNAKSMQSFVGLLPDGEYKTLCGGLTLILTAMTEHSGIREKMADLLKEVPEVVNLCEQYQTLYPGRNTMQLCVNEVYTNMLMALEEILGWYTQSSLKHIKDSLLKNNNYGKKIDVCLHNIRQAEDRLVRETQLYLSYSHRVAVSTTLETNDRSRETNSTITSIDGRLLGFEAKVDDGMKACAEGLDALKGTLDDVVKNAQWNDAKKQYVEALQQELQQEQTNSANKEQEILELREQVAKAAITPECLMRELRLKPKKHTHVQETSVVLKDGLNSSAKFQERAGWVGSNSRFQAWLGGKKDSQMLCVQGRGDFDRTSPLSFLTSFLYERLVTEPRTLVLPFFCGRSKVGDGLATMLRALVVQLLDVCKTHGYTGERGRPILSFLRHEERAQMKQNDCATYTKVLAQLLRELRKEYSAIFILIDGVDFYDSRFGEEIDDFVKSMRKLVKLFNKSDDEALGGVLRVLLTTATWSRRFNSPAKPLAVIDVPENTEGSMDGFERFT